MHGFASQCQQHTRVGKLCDTVMITTAITEQHYYVAGKVLRISSGLTYKQPDDWNIVFILNL
jgi:hypothetical protein